MIAIAAAVGIVSLLVVAVIGYMYVSGRVLLHIESSSVAIVLVGIANVTMVALLVCIRECVCYSRECPLTD
jgi:hypothetical protein